MPLTVRLGLFYGAIFIGSGVSSPYLPVWFAHHGMSGSRIGLILSLPMLARVVTAPLLAVWADSFRLRRTALMILSLAVTRAYALMALPWGFAWRAVVWFAASSMFTTLPPLADVITLRRARLDGFNFGWPRGIGSAAFIVGNLGMGVDPDARIAGDGAGLDGGGRRGDLARRARSCCRRIRCMRRATRPSFRTGWRAFPACCAIRCS